MGQAARTIWWRKRPIDLSLALVQIRCHAYKYGIGAGGSGIQKNLVSEREMCSILA